MACCTTAPTATGSAPSVASIVSGTAAARRNQVELQAHFAGIADLALRDFVASVRVDVPDDLLIRVQSMRAELQAIAGRKG